MNMVYNMGATVWWHLSKQHKAPPLPLAVKFGATAIAAQILAWSGCGIGWALLCDSPQYVQQHNMHTGRVPAYCLCSAQPPKPSAAMIFCLKLINLHFELKFM